MVPYFTYEDHEITSYICYSCIGSVSRPLLRLILPMRTINKHVTDVTPLLEMSAVIYGALFNNENQKGHVTDVPPLLEMSTGHYGAFF